MHTNATALFPICAGLWLTPLFVAAQAAVPAQPSITAPLYDVASVRENKSGSHNGNYAATPDGFKITNLPLRFLIVIAFNTREGLVFDLPPWTADSQYDINAKVNLPGNKPLTEAQQKAMLAAVLADRFHLKLHTEVRQLPVYNLVISSGGLKLKPYPPGPPPADAGGVVGNTELNATYAQLPGLANMLSDALNRNVIDQTGLTGSYDVHLKWTTDQALDSGNGKPSQDPPLFTALQEQLGLKLIPAKGPVQTWVVDHVERPTEN